jgi:hypothetical protein
VKILALVSAIDLAEPPRGTLFWWQLFKNLSELGVEILVAPFLGRSIESPWWRCVPNPAYRVADAAYSSIKSLQSKGFSAKAEKIYRSFHVDNFASQLLTKEWMKGIARTLNKERNIDVILALSIPIKPLEGVFKQIRHNHGRKIIYIEIDMPEVLPEYNTFGYSYFTNADLSIFDGFLSNSEGTKKAVEERGATKVGALHFAIDPEIYKPYLTNKNIDILFSGAGTRGRAEWIKKMIINPASQSTLRFGVSGVWNTLLPPNVKKYGLVPFNSWLKLNCSSNITLDISRLGHRIVPGTSTYRLFELCGLGCPVVTNKREGIEKWYDPRKEVYALSEDENPLEVYETLLSDKEALNEMGENARRRTLKQHTCRHRAMELISYLRNTI